MKHKKNHFPKALACTVAVVALTFSNFAKAEVVDDMKSLVEQQRFQEAFELGMKNEKLTGEPIFDYFFGIAAIDSGRASLGVLALERVLLSNPGNDLARLELARGYFVIGDYERAREEFQIMAKKDLPPSVRNSVNKYLDQIRAQDPQFRTVKGAYLEFALGHNNNVNSSTNQDVPFPWQGQNNPPILIDPGKAKASTYNQAAIGLNISGPIQPGIKYLAAFDANIRQHASIDSYDQANISLTGGAEFAVDTSRIRTIAFVSQADLAGSKLRDIYGAVIDWNKPLGNLSLRSGISFAELRYAPANEARDSNMPMFSVGGSYYLGGDWKAGVDVDFNIAREINQKGWDDLTRNIYGAKITFSVTPIARLQGNLTLGYSKSKYAGPDKFAPVSNLYKADNLYSVETALQYQLTKGWSARAEFLHYHNGSNVLIYQYTQIQVLAKLRYEWK